MQKNQLRFDSYRAGYNQNGFYFVNASMTESSKSSTDFTQLSPLK